MCVIDMDRCKGCHMCVEVCPRGNLEAARTLNKMGYQPVCFHQPEDDEAKGCNACTMCALVCPEVAIEVYRAQ
jgi:2-oxoglutarate ferredoxin oxidoreductase subunit delta